MEHINFEKFQVDQANRAITFSCASDTPYTRYDEQHEIEYDEILIVDENSVDLSRLNNGAPLLFNHDTNKLLGIVEKAWIAENRVFVRVRFSPNDDFANRIFLDVIQGLVKNVSIGYQIENYQDVQENGKNIRYVKKWLVFQVSCVSIPADCNVGIRKFEINKKEFEKMDKEEKENIENEEQEKPEASEVEPEEAQQENGEQLEKVKAENEELKQEIEKLKRLCEEAPKDENKQCQDEEIKELDEDNNKQEMEKIADDFGIPKTEVEKAIENKLSIKEFKNVVKNFNILTKKEQKKMNSFREYINNRDFSKPFVMRDFSGFSPSQLVGVEKLPLEKVLEKKLGLTGYRVLSGLQSNITIPVQQTRSTITTPGINEASTDSNPTFSNVTLSPVKFVGSTLIGKEMLVNSTDDVIAFISDSIMTEIALKLEAYMLGKIATGAANTVTYTALDAVTYDDILAMEGYLGSYNLDAIGFVCSSSTRATLKGIAKIGNYPSFLIEDNEMNGYPVNVSGAITDNKIYFGSFDKLVLGTWSGLQLILDFFTHAKQGACQVVGSLCADAAVIQPDAFVIGKVQDSSSSSGQE